MPLLLLLACAQTPCARFVDAKAACYEDAGLTDDAPAEACQGSADAPESFDELYACYADAYEAGPCTTSDEVAAAGAVASACQESP